MRAYRALMGVCAAVAVVGLVAGAFIDIRWLLASACGILMAYLVEVEHGREM